MSAAAGIAGAGERVAVPFRLMVAAYDAKLDATLLSGEFENPLERPISAWRGDLTLRDEASGVTLTLDVSHGARRPVPPGGWGVWSLWLDADPAIAGYDLLETTSAERLEASLVWTRVLYPDGTQETF